MSDDAMRALSDALLSLLEQDTAPPCADGSNAWTDDDHEVRAKVAPHCDACEIRHRCQCLAWRLPTGRGAMTCNDYGQQPTVSRSTGMASTRGHRRTNSPRSARRQAARVGVSPSLAQTDPSPSGEARFERVTKNPTLINPETGEKP